LSARVAITGMGVVSPLGSELDSFRDRLLAGESAADVISLFDASHLPTRVAAEVRSPEFAGQRDRKVLFAAAAARAAIVDANRKGAALARHYPARSGSLSLGIGLELFSMPDMVRVMQDDLPAELSPTFLNAPSDLCLHTISAEHDLGRAPLMHISACAASTDALGTAFRMIQQRARPWMLAGGADSMINPMGVAGFCKIQAMTSRNDEPKRASRPFDRQRDGFLLGEGAGVLVLEPLEEARKRGAHIYAELTGYGNSFDAHGISEPHPEGDGALLAMQRALDSAGIGAHEISHVSAHGTSTPKNDPVETKALRALLGARADHVVVTATKSMLGHLISAAGAVETIAQIVCGIAGWAHPTINLDTPDPACDLDYGASGPRRLQGPCFLKNSFAFGGQNAALVVKLAC
jgi:3-oxoacyl-[acyl-carrier-protein] synthase II